MTEYERASRELEQAVWEYNLYRNARALARYEAASAAWAAAYAAKYGRHTA